LAIFFITISHCAWRHFISLSFGDKETKQRKRLPTICIKCPQRADHCFWFPRRTVLAKPRTLEALLLANPYIPTLRHQCSRASSMAHGPRRPDMSLRVGGPRDPRDRSRGPHSTQYVWASAHQKNIGAPPRDARTTAPEINTRRIVAINHRCGEAV
jgi:hypothetical protein